MRLDHDEMLLFEAACLDTANLHAQELLNVFGAETASKVLEDLPGVPLGLFAELVGHVWLAIENARQSDRREARFVVRAAAH